jgi:hypothetical protein
MAISILWIDGFDEIGSADQKYSASERSNNQSSGPNAAYGYGRSLLVQNGWVAPTLSGAPFTVLFSAFDLILYNNYDVTQLQFEFWDEAAGAVQCYLKTALNQPTLGYDLQLYRGATLLYTWTSVLQHGIWQHISLRCKVDPTAGSVTLAVNGVDKGTFTGNTRNTANTRVDRFRLNMTASNDRVNVDNWIIATGLAADPLLPISRVYGALMPNSNVAVQWTPSAGQNWETVDEIPPNDADYNSTSTSGNRDAFSHAAPASVGGTVLAVRANARAYADASDQIQNLVRVSSTDYYGASKSPTASYFSYGHIWQNNPATSAPWTLSEAINAGFGYRRV